MNKSITQNNQNDKQISESIKRFFCISNAAPNVPKHDQGQHRTV